jgi:DNA-directed RNA polymerase sigma subunit (sigma70/sigma32)
MKTEPFAALVSRNFQEYGNLLSDREKEVLSKYYGINDVRHTLAELGELYQVTRERIRQIKVSALTKIKVPSSKDLK